MPIDKESGWVEPDIVINGKELTFAECMVVRVAVSSFRMSLTAPFISEGLGAIAKNYDHHLMNIERMMLKNSRKK